MEDIINRIDGQVQVIFEKSDGTQTYRDAIWMSEEEFSNTSSSTIDSIKQERYDSWLAIINAMPTESPAPPAEDEEILIEEAVTTEVITEETPAEESTNTTPE